MLEPSDHSAANATTVREQTMSTAIITAAAVVLSVSAATAAAEFESHVTAAAAAAGALRGWARRLGSLGHAVSLRLCAVRRYYDPVGAPAGMLSVSATTAAADMF